MCPTFRRGYNSALLAVRQSMGERMLAGGLNADERRTLAAVGMECRKLRQRTRCAPRLATFATLYAVSLRTVKNWKRAGCPLAAGRKAVIAWMYQRRILPPGPREKFAREFRALKWKEINAELRESLERIRALRKLHRRYRLPVPEWMRRM